MTTVVTSMRFACRRRTAADWTSGNEILLAGEIGYETDTDKFKIGDGVTRWNSISGYFSKTGGSGSAAWGAITGTLADQTDLATALALKVPTSRTVNGLALSANITLSASDVGADASGAAAAAQAYAIQRANHTGTQAQSTITNLVSDLALKADLVGGVVPSAQIPAIAITEFLGSVANQSAMLALSGQKGDWCIRTDLSMVYVITGNDPTQLSDWTGMAYPTAPVLSVNGHTGAVTLAPSDLGLVIGTDVQAYDADLAAIAALTPSNDDILQRKAGAWTNRTLAQLASDLGVPTLSGTNTWTGQNTFAAGTLTASTPAQWTQTWNNSGVTFTALDINITHTASAAASLLQNWRVGGTSMQSVDKAGVLTNAGGYVYAPGGQKALTISGAVNDPTLAANSGFSAEGSLSGYAWWVKNTSGVRFVGFDTVYAYNKLTLASNTYLAWSSSTDARNAGDTFLGRAAANSIIQAGGVATAGAATSSTTMLKRVTGIADATATAVFTVTVPNAAHSANVEVTLNGSLGAGGAIGANEATGSIKYNVSIARTAGVNAVATISTAYGSTTSSVAGAATITVTGDLSAISGAVGATNTFTIRVTITKGSGSSDNHTCTAHAVLLNANASGVTIA